MKKGIFGLIIIAVTAIAGWNYSKNNNDVKLLDLTLNNIEALASDEYQHQQATLVYEEVHIVAYNKKSNKKFTEAYK